jgi:hypothetical protein
MRETTRTKTEDRNCGKYSVEQRDSEFYLDKRGQEVGQVLKHVLILESFLDSILLSSLDMGKLRVRS